VVSILVRVEVPAAIWRKQRIGELDATNAQVLVEAFEADLFGEAAHPPTLVTVSLPPAILDSAARMTAVHGLRAYDAVQLASACAVRAVDTRCDAFACFDGALRRAAGAEGFRLVPA
jgi:predicted nucleic acid-binding protein